MKKVTNSLVMGSVLAASVMSSAAMASSLSGNIGVGSNYIWRGMTQTADLSAVSGGIDYSNDNGVYVGTWTSNLGGGGEEVDLYGGYGFKAGTADLDVGLISYEYPVADDYFRELYVNASMQMFTAGLAYTFDSKDNTTKKELRSGDIYIYLSATKEVSKGLEAGITLGSYNFDNAAGDDYTHFQLSLSKDDFTFAVDKNNRNGTDEDKIRVSASWSKSFDL